MAEEQFKCVLDYTASITIAASCGCCAETVTMGFDAGDVYTFDVGRIEGEIVSATYEKSLLEFDVPTKVFTVHFESEL